MGKYTKMVNNKNIRVSPFTEEDRQKLILKLSQTCTRRVLVEKIKPRFLGKFESLIRFQVPVVKRMFV